MDAESERAIRVLECIAACNEELMALSRWLESVPGIKGVTRALEFRAYKSGTMLEAYVEAELAEGKALCWWLDVSWNDQHWRIEPSVLVNDTQGQRVLRDFLEKTPRTVDDFIDQLKEATSDLAAYARSMDLSPSCV